MIVQWREIPGYEGLYEVSDDGRIRSPRTGRDLSVGTTPRGYRTAQLFKDNRKKTLQVHRLVTLAFVGPRPTNWHQVNHKNGVKADNRPSNLEWMTARENTHHAMELGLKDCRGEKHPKSKLTEAKVREILLLLAGGCTQRPLAKLYGVAPETVASIATGRNWKHVARHGGA